MMRCWGYIVKNPEGILYRGITSDMTKRLEQHNCGDSRFTSGKRPWEVVFMSEWPSRSGAQREECRVKKLNGRSLAKLISEYTSPVCWNAVLSSRHG
jgi:putative endonuclease